MKVSLRAMRAEDWAAVAEIYRQGIATGDATFETDVPSRESWTATRRPECRIVAECEGDVVGFAAVSSTSSRPVYTGVCEVMVYVAESARGGGVGAALLDALIECTEKAGIWTLLAGIFPENVASLRLHGRAGFRLVGRHERVGRFHDGRWRDTLIMERRSSVVGTEQTPSGTGE